MNLYIDIGNTAIKFAVDDSKEFKRILTVSTLEFLSSEDFKCLEVLPKDIKNVYISSVVPTAEIKISYFAKKRYGVESKSISPKSQNKIKLNIDNEEELGADLLSDLISAKEYYGYPSLVIDLGTASKFLYIDENGVFSCCAIVPGIKLSLKSLSANTALLPDINMKNVKKITDCHNTLDVLSSSSYYSHIYMVEGMVEQFKKETGKDMKIILTGGNAYIIKDKFAFSYIYDEDLCLKGLKKAFE